MPTGHLFKLVYTRTNFDRQMAQNHLYFNMLLQTHYQSYMNNDIIFVGPSYIFIVRSSLYVFIHYYNT